MITQDFISQGINPHITPDPTATLGKLDIASYNPTDAVEQLLPPAEDEDPFASLKYNLSIPDTQNQLKRFEWGNMDRYTQNKHYSTLGASPFAGTTTVDGKPYDVNELRYGAVQTFGDVMDKAAGGFAAITRNAFTEGWKGDARLFNALFGAPFSDQTFRERLMGTPEDLAEMDAETKRIMNKYAIYHTPESDNTVFNKQFLGDVIQQMGFTVGTAGQMLAEAALTWGIGEAFSAAAKGMRAGAMAERVATGAKAIPRGDIINDLRKAGNISQNTAAMKEMVYKFGRWNAKQLNPMTGALDVWNTVEAGGTGWQVAMSTVGGAKRLFSQTNMAATEARFEAAGTFGQMYGDLTSKYQDTHDGQLPTGDDLMRIQKAAYGAATDNFIVNTGILMTMNQLQFGNMFSKFSSSSKLMREALSQGEGKLFKVTGEIAGKKTSRMVSGLGEVRKNFGMGTMLYTAAKRAVTGTAAKFELTEGLQEILQETSNEALREHYTNLYNGNKDLDGRNILDAEWGNALKKQYSQEGWRTFLMGAVTGLAMSPLQASVMYGVRKGYGKVSDSYKKDIEGGKLQKEENKNIQNAFYGNIDNVLNEHIANLKVQGQGAKEMEQSLADGDKYTYMNAKDDVLTKAIASSLKTGTYESIIDSINEYADMSDEELHDAFPALEKTASSTRSAREYIGSIAEDIKQYHNNWESLKERYGHLIMPELYKGQNNQRIMQATKKKLDEAIELLATTSYHITSTINRANAVHTEVSEYPSIGSVLYSAFDKLADPKQLDTEIFMLTQEQAILDELGRDKEIQEDKKNVRERLKLLQQWKNEQSQETFEKYVEADYNQMPQGKMDRSNLHTAYERLQEYKNIKKDNENYVDALNRLNNPTAFAKLLERLEDALAYAGKEQYKEQDKESNDIVDEEFGQDEPDITDEPDTTAKEVSEENDNYELQYSAIQRKLAEKRQYQSDEKRRLIREQELTATILSQPNIEDISTITKVKYKGQEGYLEYDQESNQVYFNTKNKSYYIDKIEGGYNRPAYEYGIFIVDDIETPIEVSTDDKGRFKIKIYGQEYINLYSDPVKAINVDRNGNVISVDLTTIDGKHRTFIGKDSMLANEIAYQILLFSYEKINKQNAESRQNTTERDAQQNEANDSQRKEQVNATADTETQREKDAEIAVANEQGKKYKKQEEELLLLEALISAKSITELVEVWDMLSSTAQSEYKEFFTIARERFENIKDNPEVVYDAINWDRQAMKKEYSELANTAWSQYQQHWKMYPELLTEIDAIRNTTTDASKVVEVINKEIDKYFDKKVNDNTERGAYPELVGNPHVAESAKKYAVPVYKIVVNGEELKPQYTHVKDANEALDKWVEENHPIIPQTKYREGQIVYDGETAYKLVYDKKKLYVRPEKEGTRNKDKEITLEELENYTLQPTAPTPKDTHTPFDDTQVKSSDPWATVNVGANDYNEEKLTDNILSIPDSHLGTGEGFRIVVTIPEVVKDDNWAIRDKKGEPLNTQIIQKGQPYSIKLEHEGTTIGYITNPAPQIYIAPDGTEKTVGQLTESDVAALYTMTKQFPIAAKWLQHLQQLDNYGAGLQAIIEKALKNGGTLDIDSTLQLEPHYTYDWIDTDETGPKLSELQGVVYGKNGKPKVYVHNNYTGDRVEALGITPQEEAIMAAIQPAGQVSYYTGVVQLENGRYIPIQLTPRQISTEEGKELVEGISNVTNNAGIEKANNLLSKMFVALRVYDKGKEYEKNIGISPRIAQDSKGFYMYIPVYQRDGKDTTPLGTGAIRPEKGQPLVFTSLEDMVEKMNIAIENRSTKGMEVDYVPIEQLTTDNIKWQPNDDITDMECSVRKNIVKSISLTYKIPDKGQQRVNESKPSIVHEPVQVAPPEGLYEKEITTIEEKRVYIEKQRISDKNFASEWMMTHIAPEYIPIPALKDVRHPTLSQAHSWIDRHYDKELENLKPETIEDIKLVRAEELNKRIVPTALKGGFDKNETREQAIESVYRQYSAGRIMNADPWIKIINQVYDKYDIELKSLDRISEDLYEARELYEGESIYPTEEEMDEMAKALSPQPTPENTRAQEMLDKLKAKKEKNKENKAKKNVPKVSTLTETDVEDINRFREFMKNLPANIFSVGELDTVAAHMGDMGVTVGQFVTYLDKLGNVRGRIETTEKAPYKYHEAFHGVFRLLLTTEEQRELRKQAPNPNKEQLDTLRITHPRYTDMSTVELTDEWKEEWMADKFNEYSVNRVRPEGVLKSLFNRILDWIQYIIDSVVGNRLRAMSYKVHTGDYSNARLQQNEYTENVATSVAVPKAILIGYEKTVVNLSDGGTKEVIVDKYLSPGLASQIAADITAMVILDMKAQKYTSYDKAVEAALNRYEESYYPASQRNLDTLNGIRNKAAREKMEDNMMDMYLAVSEEEPRQVFKDNILQLLRIQGIKQQMLEEDDTDEAGRSFQDKSTIGGYSTVPSDMRTYIATTTMKVPDMFGYEEYADGTPIRQAVDSNRVYNGMLSMLSQKSDVSDMINDILGDHSNNPDLQAFINRWISESGFDVERYKETGDMYVGDTNLFHKVIKTFAQHNNDYVAVVMDPETKRVMVTDAGRRAPERNQFNSWANAFYQNYYKQIEQYVNQKEKTTKAAELYREAIKPIDRLINQTLTTSDRETAIDDEELSVVSKEISYDIQEKLGINWHPDYIKYTIIAGKNITARTTDQSKFLLLYPTAEAIDEKGLKSLKGILKGLENPFVRDEGAVVHPIETWLLKTARYNGVFDNNVDTMSFTNSLGDNIYKYQYPNYNTRTVQALNGEKLRELQSNPETQSSYLLSDQRFLVMDKKLILLGGLSLKSWGINKEDNEEFIYTKDQDTAGTDFSKMDDREYAVMNFSLYDITTNTDAVKKDSEGNTYYRVPVSLGPIAEKGTHHCVYIPVGHWIENGKITEEAKQAIYNEVVAEVNRIQQCWSEIQEGREAVIDRGGLWIDGYHDGAQRGLKLMSTDALMNRSVGGEETVKQLLEEKALIPGYDVEQERGDIYTAIESGLKEQIEGLKKLLISQELMTEKGKNLLLPQYLWSGLDSYDDKKKERDSKMNLIAGKFNHNISQVYLQNYIGYIGLSRMLYGDKAKSSKSTEDWWKRQAGNNGSTTNMVPVASSENQNPVKTVKTVLYASEKFTTIAGTIGEYDDGQAYITAQGYDTFLNGLGRNSESRKRIIEKVANGKDLTIEEYRQMLANKEAMGSLKPVAKDMYPYYKCSISALLRQDSSYKVNGEWVKLPGRDYLHDKLESAEEMENTGETVLIGNKTISKGMTANLVQADDEDIQKFYTDLNATVLGIQTEMPMTGHKGNKSTQPDKQITSGQIPTAPVYLNGKWQTSADAIRQYMDSVAQRKVNNAITAISESFSPITNLDEAYKVKFDAGKFMEKALPTLQASGTDSQTLEMMTPIDGVAQYNLNMPSTVSKGENIYFSYTIKGVTKEKVPMWKLTLRSDAGMSVIRKVTSLYPQGHEKEGQPKTWEIVPMDIFKKDPAKYSSVWEYKLDKDTDRFEGLTEGVYIADRLRDTVPQYDETGTKVLYYYTEGMRAYMSEDEKRNGKFADAWSEGMGARTPGTGFQSYRRVRWVDRVSDVLYGTGILSRDVMNATGHDYDADALYTAIPDTYMVNGQRVLYGTAGTLPEQYREYKEWQLDNNKEVQKLYYGDKWVEGEDPVAALMDKSSMRDLSSDVNNYRLEQILKGLKMPATVEEFKQMGGVELNNGVLTNRALEAQMTLLSSESVAGGGKDALINRPTSTQPVVKFGERLAEKLADSTSPWAQEVVNRLSGNTGDMNGMLGQIQAYKGLQQGGEGIGPIANMIQVASVLNQHGVEVKHKPYTFNGETYDEYTGSKHTPWHTRTGAVDILAQMHVDATKDQLPSKWAITAEYAQLLSNIIHLGQDMETALLYPQTYPWQVYAQRVAYSRRTFSLRDSRQSEDAILQDMKNKVAKKGGKRINLTQDMMIDYISKGERNWDVEYTLLDDLDTMKQNVEPLKYMSRFMRFDTGRLLSSWEEMAHVQKGLSELGIGMPEDKYQAMKVPVDVRDIITKENKSLAANYKIMRVIDTLGRKVFIEKTNLYKNIHTAVLETLTVPEYRKEWYKNLKMDILSYISLTAYMKMLRDRIRPEVLDTLDNGLIWSDGNKSIITILTDLREQNRKNYAINSFLNTVLKGAKKSANINQVVANTWTRLSEQQQQNVVKGIIELVSSEKGDIHKGGIALFNYLLVKDGGQFKSGSFIRFIPPFMMKEWSDSMTKITDMLSDPKSSEETYRELFGMESNMLRDKFVEAYATHKDNQEYIKGNGEYYRDNLKLYRTLSDGEVVEITPDGDSYQWKGAKAVFGNYPTTQQSAPKPSTTKTTVPTITYYKGTEAITIDESGNEVMISEQAVVPSQQMNVVPLSSNFSRQSVMNDPQYLYLFTDNTKRSSGSNKIAPDTSYAKRYGQGNYPTMTQAVIRGLENAYPITTMIDDKRTQWTDNKFSEYKAIIDSEVEHIKEAISSGQYKGIKFAAQMPFGKGQISNMRQSAPKIWQYMNSKLQEIGIDNTGEKPAVNTGQPQQMNSVADIPQNKVSGVESFGSTVTAAPHVIKTLGPNPHSIDMIAAGFRTRTTRSDKEMQKYNIKVGDVIKNVGKSADGTIKTVYAKVTAIYPKGSDGWTSTWNKEGWSAADVEAIKRFSPGAAAIVFEVIAPNQQTIANIQQGAKSIDSLFGKKVTPDMEWEKQINEYELSQRTGEDSNDNVKDVYQVVMNTNNGLGIQKENSITGRTRYSRTTRGYNLENHIDQVVKDINKHPDILESLKKYGKEVKLYIVDDKLNYKKVKDFGSILTSALNDKDYISDEQYMRLVMGNNSFSSLFGQKSSVQITGTQQMTPEQWKQELSAIYSEKSRGNNLTEYINHSGGAIGADSEWDKIGKEYGMVQNKHYYHGQKTPAGNTPITQEQLEEGWQRVLQANKVMKRRPEKYKSLLSRNWMQVKNSDAVYAISTLANAHEVAGGTGWAVQMAIDAGKPVYVYDISQKQWYKWSDMGRFLPTDTPTLTKNFAGIGTRGEQGNIGDAGRQAIRDVYTKSTGKGQIEWMKEAIAYRDIKRAGGTADNIILTKIKECL